MVTPQAAADAATTHLLGGQLDAPASQLLLSLGTSLHELLPLGLREARLGFA